MNTFDGYMAGVNLGGWISQFKEARKEHFDTFITDADIRKIASWGMDHVRLPIDYMVIEDEENPFTYKDEGFAYIDRCIGWCMKYNLNITLDLHRTAGYVFHSLSENRLFEDETLKQRYISLWQAFALRYKEYGRNVVFELLNEIVEPDSNRWNVLSKRAIAGIREIDKDRTIIIGGNHYNSVNALKDLDYIDDTNLVYTFHFYEPHIFTHQRAGWEPLLKDLSFTVHYPSGREDHEKYLLQSGDLKAKYAFEETMDKDYLRRYLQPAIRFADERKVRLYCGEYGVIDKAPMESNLAWHKDFSELMKEYGIGRAVWSYKLMSFPVVDRNSTVREERLVKIVSAR